MAMNLYIFPQAANFFDGYAIAVEQAYRQLSPTEEDMVVWYSSYKPEDMMYLREQDIVIPKIPTLSLTSIFNVLSGKVRSELPIGMLSFLREFKFDKIHCDDVIFYRSIREMFPSSFITVRFHNCFTRILFRDKILQESIDYKFMLTLKREFKLERKIFLDRNVYKVFLSDEDRDFYSSMSGFYSDSEVWPFVFDKNVALKNREKIIKQTKKLIWYGGIDSHKKSSVDWFVKEIFPDVQREIPEIEFHLYGGGTQSYNNPDKGIFGHGRYKGVFLVPCTDGLYVNPDVIGGGVKLKLKTYFEAGVPFISTYFGYEGYDKSLIDGKYCIVQEKEKWSETIINYFKSNHYN